ncbi:MAG: FAD binding domain-containing protein [Gemmatimonadetes bacterium]|nr:FAD binding domain-containing protein [Gemmatimonadota bacterium]
MAIIRDMIPSFDLFQPTELDATLALLAEHGDDAWIIAGGLDSYDWLKDRIKRPTAVVDIGGVAELNGVNDAEGGGLDIGAMTTLTDLVRDRRVGASYALLAEAAGHVATPQIRHQGTIGGNLAQDTRCWYYRSGWPCYRAEGNTCYASSSQSMNREHCIMGRSRCVAVNPSDTAPALIALDAKLTVLREGRGEPKAEIYDAEDFFIGPATDITRMTVMRPGDLLSAIHLPDYWAGATHYYEKVRDRNSWDFSLVTVAAAFKVSDGVIRDARISVNGVAPFPVRATAAERIATDTGGGEAVATEAGEAAVAGARALRHNDFKIPLMRNLVRRAVRSAV